MPAGWDLTTRACVLTGTATVKGFTDITNGVRVNLDAGQDVTCTFTNTKKPKLTLIKLTDPTNDLGKFDLYINATIYATGVGHNGTTGAQFANIGANTFHEIAGNSTNLADYTSVISGVGCTDVNGGTSGTIMLQAGDDKTCTITNTAFRTLTVITCLQSSNTFIRGDIVDGGGATLGPETTMYLPDDIANAAVVLAVISGAGTTVADLENNAGITVAELEVFLCSLRDGTFGGLVAGLHKPDTTIS